MRLARLACPLALVLSTSCLLVVDPEEYRPNGGNGTGGDAAGGAPSAGGSGDLGGGGSGAGGTGGASGCGCAAVVELLDGAEITSVLAVGDDLFVVQRDKDGTSWDGGDEGCPPADVDLAYDPGKIRVLPVEFTAESQATPGDPTQNVIGRLRAGTVGERNVYFAGQNYFGCLPASLHACNADDGCVLVPAESFAGQLQVLTPVGDTLYFATADSFIGSLPIDEVTGVPGLPVTALVNGYQPAIGGGSAVTHLEYQAIPPKLVWSTFDFLPADEDTGCVYKASFDELTPLSAAACWSSYFQTAGFLLKDDGTVIAQDGGSMIELSGDPPVETPFASNTGTQRAMDSQFIYVLDTQTDPQRIKLYYHDGTAGPDGPPVDWDPAGPDVATIDASHPEYLFFAVGNRVYRWPKPR